MGKKDEEPPPIDAATRRTVANIQADWDNRELVEIVQLNLLTITKFLNDFDSATRYKLARVNEKLTRIGADAGLVRGRGQGDARGRGRGLIIAAAAEAAAAVVIAYEKEAAAAALAAQEEASAAAAEEDVSVVGPRRV